MARENDAEPGIRGRSGAGERIGSRIAELRKIHGVTQRALSVRAAVSYSLLRKVERGERPASHSFLAAVARALITRPQILLADEPTGALDSRSTDELLKLFGEINASGQTIVMVTHSVRAASCASRVLFLRDGEVSLELKRGKDTDSQFYQRITDALTQQQTGGECA